MMNKFKFCGKEWNQNKHSLNQMNEHLNNFLDAPKDKWYAKMDLQDLGNKIRVTVKRDYKEYNIGSGEDRVRPEDAEIILGFLLRKPIGGNCYCGFDDVEAMYADFNKGYKLKFISQSDKEFVVEIEKK